MPINLHHLRLFHAVAQHGSVSRGAAAVRVSQPAVSREVRELERALGVPLLEPAGRGVRLTAAGRLLDEYASQIFGLAEAAERALREFVQLERGQLALGAIATVAIYYLPPLLQAFRRRYPKIDLAMTIGATRELVAGVRAGQLELSFVDGPVDDPALHAAPFATDELALIAAPDHPLARRGVVRLAELADQPFILQEPGTGLRERTDAALARAGVRVRPVMTLGRTEVIKQMVMAGLGLSVVSRRAVQAEAAEGRLCVVPLADAALVRQLVYVCRRGVSPSPAARVLLDLMAAEDALRAAAR
jgi:DNA-binding transcriptional LysR family regulator